MAMSCLQSFTLRVRTLCGRTRPIVASLQRPITAPPPSRNTLPHSPTVPSDVQSVTKLISTGLPCNGIIISNRCAVFYCLLRILVDKFASGPCFGPITLRAQRRVAGRIHDVSARVRGVYIYTIYPRKGVYRVLAKFRVYIGLGRI